MPITKNESGDVKFEAFRFNFFQALHDNVVQRFPSTDILTGARVLSKASWPKDPLQKSLYGENEVASLCKAFDIDKSLSADIVLEYALFKRTETARPKLKILMNLLAVLPISSAECERGFSQMNLYHTAVRNRLLTTSVADSMVIGINGPPLSSWNATKYVVSWLQSGKHGALDKTTGVSKKHTERKHGTRLFD